MGRLASDGDIPPMASPTYGRMVMLANDAQVALKEVRMCGEVKIPYLYTHTLSAVVHVNNILCAISMGMTLGSCIGQLLTIWDPRMTLYGAKSHPTFSASEIWQMLLVQTLKCFVAPLLYQACLEICFCLYSAFGGETEEAMVPADRMVREWTRELDGLMDLAAKPPHWPPPIFKHALSHVPDIQRTKAQMQLDLTSFKIQQINKSRLFCTWWGMYLHSASTLLGGALDGALSHRNRVRCA